MGRAHHAGLPRLHRLRDPAQRPRHHGADGTRHAQRADTARAARGRGLLSQGHGGHQARLCRHEDLRRRPALYENEGQRAALARLSCCPPRTHHRQGARAQSGRPALRRHDLPLHRGRRGQHGLAYPKQLLRLWRGHRHPRHGHLASGPRRELLPRPEER